VFENETKALKSVEF